MRVNSQLVNRVLVQVNLVVQAKIDPNHQGAIKAKESQRKRKERQQVKTFRTTPQAKTKVIINTQLLGKEKSVNLSERK